MNYRKCIKSELQKMYFFMVNLRGHYTMPRKRMYEATMHNVFSYNNLIITYNITLRSYTILDIK